MTAEGAEATSGALSDLLYNRNTSPGDGFSVTAQLYSRVRGDIKAGTVAGA